MRHTIRMLTNGLLLAGLAVLAAGCSDDDGTAAAGAIKLNELLAVSATQDDWLELYNSSDQDVAIGGYVLQDYSNYWTLPATTLKARSFLKIICDGSGKSGNAGFKLTSQGEMVSLRDGDGKLLDSVTFPALTADQSWGRVPDGSGAWSLLTAPTPGVSNSSSKALDGGVLALDGSSAAPDVGAGKVTSAACSKSDECLSKVCHRGICLASYLNKAGEACSGNGQCKSLVCTASKCAAGTGAAGTTCLNSEECVSGICTSGKCAAGSAADGGGGVGADS